MTSNPYGGYHVVMEAALDVLHARLEDDEDVVAFLVGSGLLEAPMAAPRGVLGEAVGLRDAIGACFDAVLRGDRPDQAAITRIDDWLVLAGPRPALGIGGDGWPALGERASDSPRRALGMLALQAARLLADPEERLRLKRCEGCGEVFLDRSPAGRRRWCSMATCGNRAKARRHRAARREAA
jgi:predicted RNA-binding Zn ribbon-like protein